MKLSCFKIVLLCCLLFSLVTYGQEAEQPENTSAESEEAKLAKATQNPVADLYSLPFQNNTTFNVGPRDRTQNVLNIQPVIPIGLSEGINLINRVIIPVVTEVLVFGGLPGFWPSTPLLPLSSPPATAKTRVMDLLPFLGV